jgi:hypothetical protein
VKNRAWVLTAAVVLAAGLTVSWAAQKLDDSAKDGLHVVAIAVGEQDALGKYGLNQTNFNAGTQAHFVLVDRKRSFIRLVTDECKIASFADDAGNDLIKSKYRPAAFMPSFVVGGEGHSLAFAIESSATPAPGAKSIAIKAQAVLMVGQDAKEVVLKNQSLAKDVTFAVGEMKVLITNSTLNDNGGLVSLQSEQPLDAIEQVAIVTADGKDVPQNTDQGYSSTFGEKKVYTRAIFLNQKADKPTLKVRYFQKLQKETQPVDVTIPVGVSQ